AVKTTETPDEVRVRRVGMEKRAVGDDVLVQRQRDRLRAVEQVGGVDRYSGVSERGPGAGGPAEIERVPLLLTEEDRAGGTIGEVLVPDPAVEEERSLVTGTDRSLDVVVARDNVVRCNSIGATHRSTIGRAEKDRDHDRTRRPVLGRVESDVLPEA